MLKTNKKGVFYTIALSLFIVSLLSLSLLFYIHAGSIQERQIELTAIQKITDLDSSFEIILDDLFLEEANVLLRGSNNSITFEQNFPISESTLNSKILDMGEQIEYYFNETEIIHQSNSIDILPQNITYSISSDETVTINQEQEGISGYEFYIYANSGNLSCTNGLSTGGDTLMYVFVETSSGSCTVNEASASNGQITIGLGSGSASITLSADRSIAFTSDTTLSVNTTILLEQDDPFLQAYADILIQINDTNTNTFKTSKLPITILK